MSEPKDVEAPSPHWGRTLIYDGLAQTNLDMDHHQLLNLDTSNLPISAAPPTINPPANQWLHGWNNSTRVWTATQPAFSHLSGNLSTGPGGQQRFITELGTISVGVWHGSIIENQYLPTLNAIRAPVAALGMGGRQIKSLGAPTDLSDAVTLGYLNSTLPGLRVKEAVQCATTTNIVLQNTQTIDGFAVQDQQRVLVKNQTDERLNGIYRCHAGAGVHWVRAPDSDTADELNHAYCFVRHGTVNGNTAWVQGNTVVNLGTDPVHYVYFSSATSGPPGPPGQGVPIGGTINQVLAKAGPEDYNTHWVNPSSGFGGNPPVYAYLQTVPTGNIPPPPDPTLIGKMAGLAGYITPSASGKLAATIAGFLWNTSPGGQASLRMCVGAGTAPVNGANKPPPEQCLTVGAVIASLEGGAAHAVPFSVTDVIALAAGTRYWYDLFLVPVTVGTIGVSGVSISVSEIP